MNQKKIKKNHKGMTLVEVVIAMTIFSIACAMICMSLMYAIKENSRNYKRSDDVNEEGVYAETYDPTKGYTDSDIKVQSNNISKSGGNIVNISATFGSGASAYTFETNNVYCYKAKLPGKSKTVDYQMKFFQNTMNAKYLTDVGDNCYYIIFYNDTGVEHTDWNFQIPDTGNTTTYMYNADKVKSTVSTGPCGDVLPDSTAQIGFRFDSSEAYYIKVGDFTLSSTNLDHFAEKNSDGTNTGIIYVHFDGSSYHNQEEYDKFVRTGSYGEAP